MQPVLIATSNPGKLRDFHTAAAAHGVQVSSVPNLAEIPEPIEDGATFEANARKKAEHYSRHAPGELVLADDSGLSVDVLGGEPGVRSARYASLDDHSNSSDAANNQQLLEKLEHTPENDRTARFVCVIAVARNGKTLATFEGVAEGRLLFEPRGGGGFGYDPLFYFPPLGKSFAELTGEEKSKVSHRGAAFRKFLAWMEEEARDRGQEPI